MRRYSFAWLLSDETGGGGSKPQPAQVIPAPTPPSVADTAKQSAEAQLQYNPQLTAQSVALQGQYGPQLAQQQYDLQSQYAPLYRSLIESQFPQIGTLATQTQQGLSNPSGLSTEQQTAQDAIRQRQRDELSRAINTQSNIGGTLYGGRNMENNIRGQAELSNQYANSDIALQQQQRAQTMQELLSLFQLAGFQVQQPNVPQFGQSPAASGDSLYNALVQNNGNFGIIPGVQGSPSPLYGLAGQGIGAAGTILGAAALHCHVAEELYGINDIRTFLARLYVSTHNSLFLRLYRGFSDVWAGWLKKLPWMKQFVKPIWDSMWIKMFRELEGA